MEITFKLLIGFVIAIVLHELTHLLVIVYYKIPIKSIIFTKWTAFGFLVENEKCVNDRKILFLLYFLPLIWCLFIFLNPGEPYLLMFPIVNLFGGVGDIYYFFRIIILEPDKRVEWANQSDEKILKSVIWKKEFS